ncbi:MAG: flagellar hook-associated protein FlgL [Chromatiales bacterium]|nr:flagellar hook-associated protein FlgL [Gammaproteobacteria bacterium]MCP5353215.1 flagellar hook-associated protein FlgL [Chromatiales bacterium]
MRVSTADFYRTGLANMMNKQAEAMQTQTQLSSGKRFETAGQDPLAAATAQRLNARIAELAAQNGNIEQARTTLSMEETALNGVTDILNELREIALAANNPTMDSNTLAAQATLVENRLDDLLAIANSRDENGNYLFSGYSEATQAFSKDANGVVTFHGSQSQRNVAVGDGQTVGMADTGFAVFQNLRSGNGDFAIDANAGNTGTGTVKPGEVIDPSAWDGQSYEIQLASRTAIDASALTFTDNGTDDALGYQLEINGTVVDTLAEGDTRTLDDIATNITAQAGTTGVSAEVKDGVLYLVNDNPGAGPITIRESITGATDATDAVVGFLGGTLRNANSSIETNIDAEADAWLVMDSTGALVEAGTYATGTAIEFAGITTAITGAPENGDRFTVEPSERQDLFATVKRFADSLAGGALTPTQRAAMQSELNQVIEELDGGLAGIDVIRTDLGTRLSTLDRREDANSALDLQMRKVLSSVEDADIAELATRLSEQMLALQAAQQSFIRIQGLNLFDLL